MRSVINPFLQVLETHSLGLVDLKALLDEVLYIFREADAGSEFNGYFSHFFNKLSLGLAIPRSLSMQHLEDHDSDRPNVVLGGVDILFESFG